MKIDCKIHSILHYNVYVCARNSILQINYVKNAKYNVSVSTKIKQHSCFQD